MVSIHNFASCDFLLCDQPQLAAVLQYYNFREEVQLAGKRIVEDLSSFLIVETKHKYSLVCQNIRLV